MPKRGYSRQENQSPTWFRKCIRRKIGRGFSGEETFVFVSSLKLNRVVSNDRLRKWYHDYEQSRYSEADDLHQLYSMVNNEYERATQKIPLWLFSSCRNSDLHAFKFVNSELCVVAQINKARQKRLALFDLFGGEQR